MEQNKEKYKEYLEKLNANYEIAMQVNPALTPSLIKDLSNYKFDIFDEFYKNLRLKILQELKPLYERYNPLVSEKALNLALWNLRKRLKDAGFDFIGYYITNHFILDNTIIFDEQNKEFKLKEDDNI